MKYNFSIKIFNRFFLKPKDVLVFCILISSFELYADQTLKLLKKTQMEFSSEKNWILEPDELLSNEQRQILNSGFDAFFTIQWIDLPYDIMGEIGTKNWKPQKDVKTLFEQSCKIKFDTWNEKFSFVLNENLNETNFAKSLAKVEKACIQHKIAPSDFIKWTSSPFSNSNFFVLVLAVEQLDSEKSSQLKSWFIKQQNSMFQGIFAHMIGELKTAEFTFYAVPRGYFKLPN